MNRGLRLVVTIVLVSLISMPISIVATLLLIPLWRWVEASSGLEAIGHSGPAEWCYLAMFTVTVVACLLVHCITRGRHREPGQRRKHSGDPVQSAGEAPR